MKLLAPEQRLLAARFSYGLTPALASQVRRAGGARTWFDQQLAAPVEDPAADECQGWWGHLSWDPVRLWRDSASHQFAYDYQRYVLCRRIRADRQVREVMTEFWEQLLNVPTIGGETSYVHRRGYGDTLRSLAFTSFAEILRAAVLHPAMLVYLDNARSTARQPNENLGRELLELHTVGLGAYTEAEVKDSARILTGWAVDTIEGNPSPTWAASYRPDHHATGTVSVLGFTHGNKAQDGRAVTEAYLAHLARHPLTARRLARRLAVKFVRDDPSEAFVDRLAQVYLDHDTAVVPVLQALVDSPDFAASAGRKVRDPAEDLVATYRLTRTRIARPTRQTSAANAILWQARSMGLMPLAWPRPDGAPIGNDAWCNPARMLASYRIHHVVGGGYYPNDDITYRRQRAWLPRLPATFEQVVDHLANQLLHRRATPALVRACCQVMDSSPSEKVTRDHKLLRYGMPRVLLTVLDSPEHFLR
ncbi:DUF1800 domain-containing protein [Nocardioides sp. AX2bis]|uniref:DUF1800 domain-containing protein n=1 Tax=Nocardioides sp. AX2bis TaxID=2653157 RepID=UPI0012F114C0|nr:DUF1800 domain-containing protein [Nocardioides sp. AX2bis]VXB56417.1 conserved hypothetical protein [Nocardioides sp. AX2bis]